MTPLELKARAEAFKVLSNCYSLILFANSNMMPTYHLRMYEEDDLHITPTHLKTWDEIFENLESVYKTQEVKGREKAVNKMALHIIELSSQPAGCTRPKLRMLGYTDKMIDKIGDFAIERANEMSAKAPFEILISEKSNEPPAEVEPPPVEILPAPIQPSAPTSIAQEEQDDEIPF